MVLLLMQLQQRLILLNKHALSCAPDLAFKFAVQLGDSQLVIIILPTCSGFQNHLITPKTSKFFCQMSI